jgi:hypothetical protein
MANKKVSQLVSKPSVLVTDLFPIADPTTGQLYKTTISDLGTAIGSGVSSVNTLVGAVVLDTDDIQELASPTNRWFTDTRARAAVSASSPLAYNSGTGVFSIPAATSSQNGYLTSTDWTTFNAKQTALSGTGFVKISGTTISYDNSTYLTTSAAASTYLALSGGTLTGALNGTSATFTGDLTISSANPRLYFTDTDNNPDYFISNTDGTFTVYDVTNSTSRFTIGTTGNGTFGGNLTVGQIIRSGGTSSQFLKADGSVDSTSYQPILTNPVTGTGTSGIVAKFSGTSAITDSIIYDNGSRVSIGANVTTSNTLTSVSSTTSAYAVVAQASGAANGFWATVSGTGEIFRGQTSGGSYFIINNGGNTFLNGNLNVGDFGSTSYKLNVVGTGNFTGALSGTSGTFSGAVQGVQGNFYQSSTSGFAINLRNRNANQTWGLVVDTDAVDDKNLGFYSTHGTAYALKLASTGAATFSSSVTTQSHVFLNNGALNFGGTGSASSTDPAIYRVGGGVNDLAVAIGSSERFRITSSGNVGIGTTAPNLTGTNRTVLDINGTNESLLGFSIGGTYKSYIYNTLSDQIFWTDGARNMKFGIAGAGYMEFGTNNTERMRIDSSGQTFTISEGTAFSAGVTAGAGTSTAIYVGRYGGTAGSFNSGTVSYVVWSNGNVVNTNNSYGAYSDIKLKENITDATSKLTDLLKVKIKNYNLIGDNKKQLGVIAQELEEVFPNMVEEIKDYNSNETIKSVKYSVFVPMLIKAVQELSDKITTLENK